MGLRSGEEGECAMRGGCAVAMHCGQYRAELRRHATSAAPLAAIWAGVPNHKVAPLGRRLELGRCAWGSKFETGGARTQRQRSGAVERSASHQLELPSTTFAP